MILLFKTQFIQGSNESAEFYTEHTYKPKAMVYVYKIKGWKLELDLYKKEQGHLYCEDRDGNALWFTTDNRVFYTGAPLIRLNNGRYVADTRVKAC